MRPPEDPRIPVLQSGEYVKRILNRVLPDLGTPSLHLAPGLPWTHEWSSGGSLAIGRHEKLDIPPIGCPLSMRKSVVEKFCISQQVFQARERRFFVASCRIR